MPGIQDVPGVEVIGRGVGLNTLPVGYVDGAGKVHKQIVFREVFGTEDDMMANEELPTPERTSAVLGEVIEKLGDVTDRATIRAAVSDDLKIGLPLTEQDRIAAMIFLRMQSVGLIYKFKRSCPRCGEESKLNKLDLRTIVVTPAKDPTKRMVKLTLPRSGKEAVLKVLTAKGATEVGRLRPTMKDLKSLSLLARMHSLDGKPVDIATGMPLIKALPLFDRNLLRQTWIAMEASVDDDINVECKSPTCRFKWAFPLDVGQSFFLDLDGEVDSSTLTWL